MVYINKKAIEYVVQEFNKEGDKKGTIKSIAERIIYPTEQCDSIPEVLRKVVSEVVNYFRLSPEIDPTNAAPQKAQGPSVTVSNSLYISIFDKSHSYTDCRIPRAAYTDRNRAFKRTDGQN